MDTLAALAFSGEPPLDQHLEEKPKSRNETLISKSMWNSIMINGVFMAVLSMAFLKVEFISDLFAREGGEVFLENYKMTLNEVVLLTAFFAIFVLLNNFNKFNVRVDNLKLLDHILRNKGFIQVVVIIFVVQFGLTYFGGEMFRTIGLTAKDWVLVLGISFLIIPFDMLRKVIFNK